MLCSRIITWFRRLKYFCSREKTVFLKKKSHQPVMFHQDIHQNTDHINTDYNKRTILLFHVVG